MLRFALLLAGLAIITPAHATEAGWALLRNGGQIAFLIHANAPGSGDPANFDIENCRTQRNLSERGRHQARRIGALLAARSAPFSEVYSSRYCRTKDTADLVFGEANVELLEALDLLTGDEEANLAKFQAVHELALGYTGSGNLVMVTHDANVREWVGTSPREGELVIVTPMEDGFRMAGRIVFN